MYCHSGIVKMSTLRFIFAVFILYCIDVTNCQTRGPITYFLYTRNNLITPVIINQDLSPLKPELPLKVIIHGATESVEVQWYKDVIRAYLTEENCNVIAVDWSESAQRPYIDAVASVRPVGISIGTFLVKIDTERRNRLESTHIVGHSLGAHVAGFAGKQIYQLTTNRKVSRITGLDPAGPLFEYPVTRLPRDRLYRGDANFVDVVHTDGGVFGFRASIGNIDFFPNGGTAFQPGCPIPSIGNVTEYFCSHSRSHELFIESINSKRFKAKACASWIAYKAGFCDENQEVVFGEHAQENTTGKFYLRTNAQPPYAVGSRTVRC